MDLQYLRGGMDLQYLRGHGYDGASNMSGSIKGVQACMAHDHPLAPYVHCVSHALNLVLCESCSVPPVRNCLGVVSGTITLFRASPKRSGVLGQSNYAYQVTSSYTSPD